MSIIIHSNNIENIVFGTVNAKWNARGDRILRYYIDIRHLKLNLHRELSAPDISILQSKMDTLMASWDEKFEIFTKRENIQAGQNVADELETEASLKLDSLKHILTHTLAVDDAVDWEALKDKSEYNYPESFPEPKPFSQPSEHPQYIQPEIGIIQLLLGKKSRIIAEAEAKHEQEENSWKEANEERIQTLAQALSEWEKNKKLFWDKHDTLREEFYQKQSASHAEVDRLKSEVSNGDDEAVVEHASLVLEASDYDGLFEKSYLLQYTKSERLLKVAYDIPASEDLPTIKSVKFVKSTGELREASIALREQKANFESVAYQICLRTIHELFEADENGNFESILFNGFVNFVNPATGQDNRSCLLSVLVDREQFCEIDLARIDPKMCFKSLKGVSASSLASLTPIPPVMELETEDRRFIDSREVGSSLDQSTNLASISWEDFEHLVRELFEKEFISRGGEVKVTQSSSDGGVDAIAFDPDPITGGKIVIQAKRYTRTVGVSAVRDLYGTIMNEGASRGILVTTSDYGPDAHKFSTGKPITLMNGANLLHMLKRHGYEAKIDIEEARALY